MYVFHLLATMVVHVPLNKGWPIVTVQTDLVESIVKEVSFEIRRYRYQYSTH